MARVYGIYMLCDTFHYDGKVKKGKKKGQLNQEHLECDTNIKSHIWFLINQIFEYICRPFMTPKLIILIETKINEFMRLIEEHLPTTFQTLCMHMLLHIPQQLRHFGPCRISWLFCYERYNSYLASLIHSRTNPCENMMLNTSIAANTNAFDWDDYDTKLETIIKNENDYIFKPKATGGKDIRIDYIQHEYGFRYYPNFRLLSAQYKLQLLKSNSNSNSNSNSTVYQFHQYVSVFIDHHSTLFKNNIIDTIPFTINTVKKYNSPFTLNNMKLTTYNPKSKNVTASCHFRTRANLYHDYYSDTDWLYGTILSYYMTTPNKNGKSIPFFEVKL